MGRLHPTSPALAPPHSICPLLSSSARSTQVLRRLYCWLRHWCRNRYRFLGLLLSRARRAARFPLAYSRNARRCERCDTRGRFLCARGERGVAAECGLTSWEVDRPDNAWCRKWLDFGYGRGTWYVSPLCHSVIALICRYRADLGPLDDNLTLPIISGGCIWGFFKVLEYFTGSA